MKINVIGLGYIGLPTALSLAAGGLKVTGTDKKQSIVDSLQAGDLTFKEKGLQPLFEKVKNSGNLTVTTECVEADVYIISVPTPYIKINKRIDTTYVEGAVRDVLRVCPDGAIIAVESTISPGTMEKFIRPLIVQSGKVPGKDVHIAHVPERIIPGNMIYELTHNSRTIGVDETSVGEVLRSVYSVFCQGDMVITDIKTAEMTKVIENTFRDINIAFANELAKICRRDDMDVYEVIRVANMHPRVNILQPGPGVGGHCISVDPWFLVGDYPDIVNIIRHARMINDEQPEYVLSRMSEIMEENNITSLSEVGLYGLTYKENVDDTRESPTLQLLEVMKSHAAYGVKVYDPFVSDDMVPNQYKDFEQFIQDVKLVVILVAHDHIKDKIDKLKGKVIFDTINCIKNEEIHSYLL